MTIDIKIIKSDIDMNKRPEKVIDSVTQSDRVLQKKITPKKSLYIIANITQPGPLGPLGNLEAQALRICVV